MAVSDKMAIVIKDYIEWLMGIAFPDSEAEITQSIINAAWTDFNPDDESTWPKKVAPLLIETFDGEIVILWWHKRNLSTWTSTVSRYADPEHFRYEGE